MKVKEHEFLNINMHLVRPSKEVESNIFTLKVDKEMSKPEIKNYLEKVYGFKNIKKVNTLITMGKIVRSNKGSIIIRY